MDKENFFENLYKDEERLECVEVSLNTLLRMALELGELRGRMATAREALKAIGEDTKIKDLLIIVGGTPEEECNA